MDIQFGNAAADLSPCPIVPEWVLEGRPVARTNVVSVSADGTASTVIWDCTAGRFNWFYHIDETVYVLDGSVMLIDDKGGSHLVRAGDMVFFPAGSRAEWVVETYIKKVAFLRSPLPVPVAFARRTLRRLVRWARGRGHANASPMLNH